MNAGILGDITTHRLSSNRHVIHQGYVSGHKTRRPVLVRRKVTR